MKKKNLTVVLLIVLLLFCVGCTENNSSSDEPTETKEQTINVTEQSDSVVKTASAQETIDNFVEKYNISANNKLVFNEDFIVSDRKSDHYRTEFRLTAYVDAIGKSYYLDDLIVDIISNEEFSGDVNIRIYADGASLNQCIEIIENASPLLDPTIDTATISKTVDYISENKEANGYYYGELGLLLLENESKGYNLMINTD